MNVKTVAILAALAAFIMGFMAISASDVTWWTVILSAMLITSIRLYEQKSAESPVGERSDKFITIYVAATVVIVALVSVSAPTVALKSSLGG